MFISNESIRLVAVMNKRIEPGVAMNAIFHLGAGITNLIGALGCEKLQFLDFEDASSGLHPSISARSFVVLRATSNEIKKLRDLAASANILSVDFTSTMTGETFREQLEKTKQTAPDDLEYFGIALFGEKEVISPLTRKLSLWN